MKKYERKSKDERRRVLLSKNNVKSDLSKDNLNTYMSSDAAQSTGAGAAVLAKVQNVNKRIMAFALVIALTLTVLLAGFNIHPKAVTGDQVPMDGNYTTGDFDIVSYRAFVEDDDYTESDAELITITGNVSFTVSNGIVTNISINTNSASLQTNKTIRTGIFSSTTENQRLKYTSETVRVPWTVIYIHDESKAERIADQIDQATILTSHGTVDGINYSGVNSINNDLANIRNQPATYETFENAFHGAGSGNAINNYPEITNAYDLVKEKIMRLIEVAPIPPRPNIASIDDVEIPEIPESAENNFVLDKSIAPNTQGDAYNLTLKAYSTAELDDYPVMEKIPTDYVLVIDQSGSMATSDMPTSYQYAGRVTLEDIAAGKYYYVDEKGDSFRVFPVQDYVYEYIPSNTKWTRNIVQDSNAGLRWFQRESSTDETTTVANQYYYLTDDGVFRPITVTIQGSFLTYYVRLHYIDANGQQQRFDRGSQPEYKNLVSGADSDAKYVPGDFGYDAINWALLGVYDDPSAYTYTSALEVATTGMYINYPMYKRHVGYNKLCYRDNNGNIQTIESDSGLESTSFCNSNGEALTSNTGERLYYSGLVQGTNFETRLDTLETALQAFAKQLQNDKDSFGLVDNRVAVVGFSSKNDGYNYQFNNMEVLTGSTISYAQSHDAFSEGSSYFPYKGENYNTTSGNSGATNYNGPQYYAYSGLNSYGQNAGYNVQVNSDVYGNALIPATTEDNSGATIVNPDFTKAIKSLSAWGGTQPEIGLDMAKEIYDAREVTQYTKRTGNKETVDRNKVVIFFTDGEPGDYRYSDRYVEANEVVAAANALKHYSNPGEQGESPAKVFSIGVFGDADSVPLTYAKYTETNTNNDYNYELTWWETYSYGGYNYYLNRYWDPLDEANYGEVANDTVYDYMMSVSSNYPNATKFISDSWATNHGDSSTTWTSMVSSVRGNPLTKTIVDGETQKTVIDNKYYRLATNEESLIEAFKSAASVIDAEYTQEVGSVSEDSALIDVIDLSNFDIPIDLETGKPPLSIVTIRKAYGEIPEGATEPQISSTLEEAPEVEYEWLDSHTLSVTKFNYNTNYIAKNHTGYELQVLIEGLTPKIDKVDTLTSNKSSSGIYSEVSDDDPLVAFEVPFITRHSYSLDVGTANEDGKFDISAELINGSSALDNVIVVSPDGTRMRYLSQAFQQHMNKTFTNMGNEEVFYLENVPSGYNVKTSTLAKDNAYTYTLTFNNETSPEYVVSTDADHPTERTLPYSDNILHITSVANNRTVTIKETVSGNYANDLDAFTPVVYIAPADGVLPDSTQWPSGWQQDGTANRLTPTTPISAIRGNGTASVDITVPAGWKLFIEQTEDNEYVLGDITYEYESGTSGEYSSAGIVVSDNTEVIIDNVRNSITVEGSSDQTNAYTILLIILAGVVVTAGGAGGIYLYKKKDEFTE